jgi:hypothetical protein
MQFPLSSADRMLWLGITAILLLVTSELLSPYYGQTTLLIERKKLRLTALVISLLFVLDALVQIYAIFTY